MAKKSEPGHMEFVKWFGLILDALRALGESAKPKEVREWIANSQNLSDAILNECYEKTGSLKFPNQVAFARQYLVWEGLIDGSERGIWTLTARGKETFLTEKDAYKIAINRARYFQELREDNSSSKTEENLKHSLTEQTKLTPSELEIQNSPSLIEILQNLSPNGFEHLCGRLLREYGFEQIQITQRTRDGGIDGYGILKTNPFVSLSIAFQCKRWKNENPVGSKDVQAFLGANISNPNRRSEKIFLITTSFFTKDALKIEEANSMIELIDGEQLVRMFEDIGLGVIPKTVYEPNFAFFKEYLSGSD